MRIVQVGAAQDVLRLFAIRHRWAQHHAPLLAEQHDGQLAQSHVACFIDSKAVRQDAQHAARGHADAFIKLAEIRLIEIQRKVPGQARGAPIVDQGQDQAGNDDQQKDGCRIQMHPARAAFDGRCLREAQCFDFRQRKTLQMKQGNSRCKQGRKQAVHLAGIQKGAFPAGRVLRQKAARIQRGNGADGKHGGAQVDGTAQARGRQLGAQVRPFPHETEQARGQGVRQFVRQSQTAHAQVAHQSRFRPAERVRGDA
ncbi:hypothetical protein D3C72_1611070 [compost metagenome]